MLTTTNQNRNQLRINGSGMITENYPVSASVNVSLMISQTIYFQLVGLTKGDIITNINVTVTAQGTTTTSTFVALYDSTGVRLAVSNDLTTALDTTGLKSLALTAPYTVLADGAYYLAILTVNGTPANCATLARASSNSIATGAVGAGVRVSGTQTGQTTMPAPATVGVGTVLAFWMAAS